MCRTCPAGSLSSGTSSTTSVLRLARTRSMHRLEATRLSQGRTPWGPSSSPAALRHSRNIVSWATSSASASSRSMRLAIASTLVRWRSTRPRNASSSPAATRASSSVSSPSSSAPDLGIGPDPLLRANTGQSRDQDPPNDSRSLAQQAAPAHHRRQVGLRDLAVAVEVEVGEPLPGPAIELGARHLAVAVGIVALEEAAGGIRVALGHAGLEVGGIDEAVAVAVEAGEATVDAAQQPLQREGPALLRLLGGGAVLGILASIVLPAAQPPADAVAHAGRHVLEADAAVVVEVAPGEALAGKARE